MCIVTKGGFYSAVDMQNSSRRVKNKQHVPHSGDKSRPIVVVLPRLPFRLDLLRNVGVDGGELHGPRLVSLYFVVSAVIDAGKTPRCAS